MSKNEIEVGFQKALERKTVDWYRKRQKQSRYIARRIPPVQPPAQEPPIWGVMGGGAYGGMIPVNTWQIIREDATGAETIVTSHAGPEVAANLAKHYQRGWLQDPTL